jgi:hypothetical protein
MDWKGYIRKRSWHNFRGYPGIFLEGLGETTKNLSQDIRSLGRDLNLVPSEYEAEVLSSRQRRSDFFFLGGGGVGGVML